MPRKKRDVESALAAKGFQLREGDHHFYVYYTTDGKKTRARTKTSHTPKMKSISDDLLSKMTKQVHLDAKKQFLDLVDCPMSREQYEAILVDKGLA